MLLRASPVRPLNVKFASATFHATRSPSSPHISGEAAGFLFFYSLRFFFPSKHQPHMRALHTTISTPRDKKRPIRLSRLFPFHLSCACPCQSAPVIHIQITRRMQTLHPEASQGDSPGRARIILYPKRGQGLKCASAVSGAAII